MDKKLVIFDFADTIARLSPSKEVLLQNFVKQEIALEIPIENISEVYHYCTNLMLYSSVKIDQFDSKKEFYINFNNALLALLGIADQVDGEKLFNYFVEHGQYWILKEGVEELFKTLKSNGILISLVSNFDTKLFDVLKEMQIMGYFDSIFVSQEVGLEKPDIEFFKLPLMEHQISPNNTYFIGDSYVLDFIPSQKMQMHSILLDEYNRYPFVSNQKKIYRLEECLDVIFASQKDVI